ncbi:sigma-70 family RNA polymerase sigma factor [Nonomuraea sp. NPDC050202]|uniref:sigma-70 family RNA polymerase sigma factor n=1 Tax=Nonomuraea sp. NPDC050202 TaxID=3155035 RepID=UPI0033D775F9
MLASLVGFLGDFDRAEEAVQEAFAIAAERWPATGMPDKPGAWLVTTARNRAIDRVRRERALAGKVHLLHAPEAVMEEFDDTVIKDERLELIFACCHPALPLDGQVALTLRAFGGLDTAEIARAFLVSEETMKRRLSRAKAKIKATGIPFAVPAAHRLPDRLDAVLAVVYLIYNEGYRGRIDLGAEALRLGRLLAALLPDQPEAHGLLELMVIHHARRRARFRDEDLVLLDDQDRSLWDQRQIAEGRAVLDRAIALGGRGAYVVQAAIASLQARERIDWPQVAALYRRLAGLTGSAVVELNRAVALAQAGDPAAALGVVDRLDLDGYLYFHSTRGELLRRLGRPPRPGPPMAGRWSWPPRPPSGASWAAGSNSSEGMDVCPSALSRRRGALTWEVNCPAFVRGSLDERWTRSLAAHRSRRALRRRRAARRPVHRVRAVVRRHGGPGAERAPEVRLVRLAPRTEDQRLVGRRQRLHHRVLQQPLQPEAVDRAEVRQAEPRLLLEVLLGQPVHQGQEEDRQFQPGPGCHHQEADEPLAAADRKGPAAGGVLLVDSPSRLPNTRIRAIGGNRLGTSNRRPVSNALGLAVLGLLIESPLHPHAMAATLRERGQDRVFKVTTGSLYDVVRALERAGWIEARETVKVGARPERTVYQHTALGRAEFARWVEELIRVPSAEYPKFLSAVGYLGALGPGGAVDALRDRAARVRATLEEHRREHGELLAGGTVPRLFVVEVEYAIRMQEAEVGWIEEIVADIETGRLAWPDASGWVRAGEEGR